MKFASNFKNLSVVLDKSGSGLIKINVRFSFLYVISSKLSRIRITFARLVQIYVKNSGVDIYPDF